MDIAKYPDEYKNTLKYFQTQKISKIEIHDSTFKINQ